MAQITFPQPVVFLTFKSFNASQPKVYPNYRSQIFHSTIFFIYFFFFCDLDCNYFLFYFFLCGVKFEILTSERRIRLRQMWQGCPWGPHRSSWRSDRRRNREDPRSRRRSPGGSIATLKKPASLWSSTKEGSEDSEPNIFETWNLRPNRMRRRIFFHH